MDCSIFRPQRLLFSFAAIACLGGTVLQGTEPTASANRSGIWSTTSLNRDSRFTDGILMLTPQDAAWKTALAFGRNPLTFQNKSGLTISLRLTVGASTVGERGETVDWIGLTPNHQATSLQAADNFVGIALTVNRSKGYLYAALARKEAGGKNEKARGDSHGNIVNYGQWPGVKVPLKGDSFDLILSFTVDRVSATIAGSSYAESYPSGLTVALWRKAFLAAQCMNCNDGRGSLAVKLLSSSPDITSSERIVSLDLRPWANMGFRDEHAGDKRGGWTDQGENDLRHLSAGLHNESGLPFDIIDPKTNNGKSCLLLYSKNKDFFPKTLGPVKINRKAASLIFLHSCAWVPKEKVLAAIYRVNYDDGTKVDIPIKVDDQITDWWNMKKPGDPNAAIMMKVKSDKSATGMVSLCGYRWTNPHPDKNLQSLSFISAEGNPVVGILAVSLVPAEIGKEIEPLLQAAFQPDLEIDYLRNSPDAKKVSDQVFLRTAKTLKPGAFSVAGSYRGGDGGEATLHQQGYAELLQSFGGISRAPYGLEISFYFWPWKAQDWYPVLGQKGGNYGTIEKWFYKWGKPELMLSYQDMLKNYKRMGLKLILLFNCHSMFDGKDFIYVKTMPEEKMRRQNPLDGGKFSEENLRKIVANNATLVDYIIKNGYEDTVAYWEMDNERWDMPGDEYAETVAAHVKMLRSKLPKAKVIVCLGELPSYSINPTGVHAIVWSKELLAGLQRRGMDGQINYFAPHLYPFLKDKAEEITANHLADYSVRNIYRSLDYMAALLDRYGFSSSQFYISEWGTQSDNLGDTSRNELLNSMAAAIATAKDMMAIYSHPRVFGSTLHTFLHASYICKEQKKPISRWGGQSVFIDADGKRFIGTPLSEAVKLFINFTRDAVLTPGIPPLPQGVHCLKAENQSETRYFVVNSTPVAVKFPTKGEVERFSLFADSVTATSIVKYGSYGDRPGDVNEIVPRHFSNAFLPPYSVNLLKLRITK